MQNISQEIKKHSQNNQISYSEAGLNQVDNIHYSFCTDFILHNSI